MNTCKFTKMHGLGNDFIVISLLNADEDIRKVDFSKLAKKICCRRTGVGADGILLVVTSDTEDLRMRIINSDGSEADMCGNGIRCFAKYAHDNGLFSGKELSVETGAGKITATLTYEGDDKNGIDLQKLFKKKSVESVSVQMGKADFLCKKIPMINPEGSSTFIGQKLSVCGREFTGVAVLSGVPHFVTIDDGFSESEIAAFGSAIEKNDCFPFGTNVDFIRLVDANTDTISLRTWERGCGRTLACGTGACASACAYKVFFSGKENVNTVHVNVDIGTLTVTTDDNYLQTLSGPAETTYSGSVCVDIDE